MRRGLLSTFESWRRIGLIVLVLVAGFLFFALSIPTGVLLLGLVIAASFVWKPIGILADPTLGSYIPNTTPFRVAMFFTAVKTHLPKVLSPLVLVGFGPPAPDRDHDMEAGWLPPTRLSAWWSLIFGLIAGAADIALEGAHKFIIGGGHLPWFLMYPVSVIGWFALGQLWCAIRRIQGDANTLTAVEPKPAVMIHKSRAEIPFAQLIPKALIFGSAPAVIVLLVGFSASWPIWITLSVPAVLLILGGLIAGSRIMTKKYLEGWEFRNQRRDHWLEVWGFMRDKNPILVDEFDLPTIEQFDQDEMERVNRINSRLREGQELEEPRMYEPQVKVAIFQFPPNAIFADYSASAIIDRVKGQIGSDYAAISPIGSFMTGAEQAGTIGFQGFRLWWTEREPEDLLAPNADNWMREFMVRAKVISTLNNIRAIGYCSLINCGMLTRPESEVRLLEVRVVPPTDTTIEDFLSNLSQIKTALGVNWVRAAKFSEDRDAVGATANAITLYIGDLPDITKMKTVNPRRQVMIKIDKMNWLYYFDAVGLRGNDGPPSYVERRPATDIVDKLVFRLPDGMSFEALAGRKSALMSTSGFVFMEIEPGDAEQDKGQTEEQKIAGEAKKEARFTLIGSSRDPLKRVFSFGDYKDKILFPRQPGVAQIDWVSGIMADDEMSEYSWDSEEPHLLIAGSSGSGKALDVAEPILTTKGEKTMGDIVPGDIVYDMNGEQTKVIRAFKPYTPTFGYSVVFDDDSTIIASGNHLWSVLEATTRYPETVSLLEAHIKPMTGYEVKQLIAKTRRVGEALSQADASEAISSVYDDKAAYFIHPKTGNYVRADAWTSGLDTLPTHLKGTVKKGVFGSKIQDDVKARLSSITKNGLQRPRFDALGLRVLSPGELSRALNVSPEVIIALVSDANIKHTAVWRFPVIIADDQDAPVSVSLGDETPLYSVAAVARHLANAYSLSTGLDPHDAEGLSTISPELIVLTTSEIKATIASNMTLDMVGEEPEYHFAIPYRPKYGSDRNLTEALNSWDEGRYIKSVDTLDQGEVPLMRCISVDSPTRTYRAGKQLIPTHNSVVASSMILQLIHNNAPTEAQLWMIEPKTEMQIYKNVDSVTRFVDSWTPDNNFMSNAADLMEDAVAEMERRNQAFISHPKQPKKLSKAREIAVRESHQNGTPLEEHPLYFPYIIVIMEECASLFADAADKDEKIEQGRLLKATAEIARKARSAGIHLVALTQYPTNASIPSVIRNQMSRIGLKCQNDLASRIVINQNGLEKISVKGVGMMKQHGELRSFRGLWIRDGDEDLNEQNDIIETLRTLPTKGQIVVGAAGQSFPQVFIPNPSQSVYNIWDSRVGERLKDIVDKGLPTRDVVDV